MAIAVEMTFAGATLEQYDQVVEKMGFRPGGPGAEGGLFHWVTAEPGGIRVVDVWISLEEFQRFAAEKIGPITRSVGVEGEPEVRTYPVHSYLTAG
jgi:hypothetical protein